MPRTLPALFLSALPATFSSALTRVTRRATRRVTQPVNALNGIAQGSAGSAGGARVLMMVKSSSSSFDDAYVYVYAYVCMSRRPLQSRARAEFAECYVTRVTWRVATSPLVVG